MQVGGKQLPSTTSAGKQLPLPVSSGAASPSSTDPAAAVVPSNETQSSSAVSFTPSWRARDMAARLLTYRKSLVESHMNTTDHEMPMSTDFDVRATLSFLQAPNNAAVVRQAFDLAATAVLNALQKPMEPDEPAEIGDIVGLPKELQAHEALIQLRHQALERAHNNKEYAKRKSSVKIEKKAIASVPKRTKAKITPTTSTAPEAAVVETKAVDSIPSSTLPKHPLPQKSKIETETIEVPEQTPSTSNSLRMSTTKPDTTTVPPAPKEPTTPKFTRNTPASSAAALDFRFNSSRAILCAAGNLVFAALTPVHVNVANDGGVDDESLDIVNVPQNPKKVSAVADDSENTTAANVSTSSTDVNMGAVVVEARKLGQRTISVVENATRRSKLRYEYRKANARQEHDVDESTDTQYLVIPNPFDWDPEDDGGCTDEESRSVASEDLPVIPYQPMKGALTEEWNTACLPRLLSILHQGAGHALYHDVNWSSRYGRVANLLRTLANEDNNYGPHLILTTEPEVRRFAQEFHDLHTNIQLVTTPETRKLQVLAYQGGTSQRRSMRRHFSKASGLSGAPLHVLVASYADFLEDFLHFCQVPLETVVLDDGASWMAAAQGDQNSALGHVWTSGIFSANDHQTGLAGTAFRGWDFQAGEFSEAVLKDAWVGLTSRHRILVAASPSPTQLSKATSGDVIPVSGLIDFLAPHFSDVVREEWDRSRITSDAASMEHFRKLVARSTVVHHAGSAIKDMKRLALLSLTGELPPPDRSYLPRVHDIVQEETFVLDNKIAFSRRSSLVCLGPPETSWLRFELGKASFQNILEAMKASNHYGHFCEEITTASSTTSSGANGQVAGTMAFRPAVCCGRHFGSEQGLRQHVSALHAPPGTWLCRTCGSDCITSQARTHHERSCGQPSAGSSGDQAGTVGATPTVGQGGVKSGVGKKKASRPGSSQQIVAPMGEKDPDGSLRVPGYRGVWVSKEGKHFIKIDGQRFKRSENDKDIEFFDSIDDAAKKHDEVIRKGMKSPKAEFNFKPDGSKIVYEDITPASTSGLGGSASNVVPALSVINIKDLPPDVKPLLRDPRQTSRTGGNSKRHIYAYRGVCRQARKGHDRWQSQISFMGVNHYLGTFDSEWDAAAIYAWAHLILYGEEATRAAQKEGEEAAAAYEQEKRDIASGKIPEPTPKPEKKKKPVTKKLKTKEEQKNNDATKTQVANGRKVGDVSKKVPVAALSPEKAKKQSTKKTSDAPKKRKLAAKEKTAEKKFKASPRYEKEAIGTTVAKGVSKAPILSYREIYAGMKDAELTKLTAHNLTAAIDVGYWVADTQVSYSAVDPILRPCIPAFSTLGMACIGGAMLYGLSPSVFEWNLEAFIENSKPGSEQDTMTAIQMLAVEYDEDGVNEKFRSAMQGTMCVLGSASKTTQRAYKALGFGAVPFGGSVGRLDCHVGGMPGSCTENAACITFATNNNSSFQFSCLSNEDIVTHNGKRLLIDMGSLPLQHNDVCSVGARVFAFICPDHKG